VLRSNYLGKTKMKITLIRAIAAASLGITLLFSQIASAQMTVPAGTGFLVRTSQTLSSSQLTTGYRFTGRLEADLVADGEVVAPRGSTVYGIVTQAKKSGRLAGKGSITFTLTDIMINNQMRPVVTTDVAAESGETAGKTAGTTARAAAVGGLIDGKSGAKTGAKVGLGASLLTRGNSATIPSGSLLDFRLLQPFSG
jgi:hypothetical protein